MRDLHELALLPCSGQASPPPTASQIAVVERLVGKTLPKSYVDFLSFCNGCYTERNWFIVETDWGQSYHLVAGFYTISAETKDTDDSGEVVSQYRHRGPGVPRDIVPIALTPLGDIIYLDLRKAANGRVVLLQHERPVWASGKMPANTALIVFVAPSFEAFLDLLTDPPEEE
jgi:hypothetical protein